MRHKTQWIINIFYQKIIDKRDTMLFIFLTSTRTLQTGQSKNLSDQVIMSSFTLN